MGTDERIESSKARSRGVDARVPAMWGVVSKRNLTYLAIILLTFAAVQLLRTFGIVTSVFESTVALICINIILAVSLNLITGFTGQFSLGHAGFMSIGAYATALILLRYPTVPGFVIGLFVGGILAMLAGILIGFPTLRLKGDYLAIATLGFAEIIRVVFQNMEITGGPSGLASIPRMATWPWMFGLTVITILTISNFIRSSRGRACIAIREDEPAAEAMGINSTKYKVMAFALGAFFAGIAGGLYASYFYFINPAKFGFLMSINILVIVVLGGMGSLTGSVIAATILTLMTTSLRGLTGVNNIIYALLLIVMMLFRPKGLMGTVEVTDLLRRIRLPWRGRGVEELGAALGDEDVGVQSLSPSDDLDVVDEDRIDERDTWITTDWEPQEGGAR